MPYAVRLMCKEDIAQVTEIDREAFSTQWPPPNYKNELQNRLARYVVVYDEAETVAEPEEKDNPAEERRGLVSRLKSWLNLGRFSNDGASSRGQYIIGFAGIWVLADESHITNIAVRQSYQRRGIGELLLIHTVEQSKEMKAETMTLEVRVSNTTAQSLYSKYGFTQVGLRRGYYTDNREDGMLMSTESIISDSFQERLQQLKQNHSGRWGIESYQLVKD